MDYLRVLLWSYNLLDIVLFLVQIIEEKSGKEAKNFKSFAACIDKLNLINAGNIADLSSTNPLIPLRPTDTLLDAFSIFEETGTHRIPILKEKGCADIEHILTQIDVIRYLTANINSLGSQRKKTLKELKVPLRKVISVDIKTGTIEAFKLMVENQITAVAVVNPDGTLLSSVSAKDIKEAKPEELLGWMRKSVIEFVQMIRGKQMNVSYPVFSCHLHSSLEEVIMKLSVLRVHRLYITDSNNKPIGVLSLGDIFKLMNNFSPEESEQN